MKRILVTLWMIVVLVLVTVALPSEPRPRGVYPTPVVVTLPARDVPPPSVCAPCTAPRGLSCPMQCLPPRP